MAIQRLLMGKWLLEKEVPDSTIPSDESVAEAKPAVRRARRGGKFVKDDPETPAVNEAWVDDEGNPITVESD